MIAIRGDVKTMRRAMTAVAVVTGCVLTGSVAATAQPRPTGPGAVPHRAAARSTAYRSLCAPPADTVGPVLSKIGFGRSSVNLNTGSRTQTIQVSAADTSGVGDPSGVRSIRIEVEGRAFYRSVTLRIASGTAASGRWIGRFTLSRYDRPGTYRVEYATLTDRVGNGQSYTGYGYGAQGPNSLYLLPGGEPTFTVTGTSAPRPKPKAAGYLDRFSFTPTTVNTTTSAKRILVRAHFRAAGPRRVEVSFFSEKRLGIRFFDVSARMRHHPGGWFASVRIPRWLGRQILRPSLFIWWGNDHRPSERSLSDEDLAARHFPSRLRVISTRDRSRPTLTALTFSPRSVDSTKDAVTVTISARARDVGAGVRTIDVNGRIRGGVNGVAGGSYPLASAGVGYLSDDFFFARLRKTAAGTWVGTTRIRRCVPSGRWMIDAVVSDLAGNDHYYSTKQLTAAHLAGYLDVTSQHGDVEAPYVYSAATYGADSELLLNFSEGVANVDTSTLAVYALSPAKGRFTTSAMISGLTCANGTTTVDCSGANGLVTSAVLTVPSLTPGVRYQVYANLNQVVPQLVDGNRNPMDWDWPQAEVKDS